jgi:murein DD-endopeptidase MepM/ murein hydrolase activator NlpD
VSLGRIDTATARLVALGLLCLTVVGAGQPQLLQRSKPVLTVWQQVNDRCKALAIEPLAAYPWPIAPFDRQHPVRGNFGDPRTVFTGGGEGAFSFHNGVDIAAWTGNHVFPVVSGVVSKIGLDRVVVQTDDGRRFQYIHVAPAVVLGQQVVASRTVLGIIRPGWNHVHLSEIRDDCAVNPLMPGHLTPYRDTTRPTVASILFENAARQKLSPLALTGAVQIVADAYDTPALPSPFPWGSKPVAPALITWTLATIAGRVLLSGTAADFRYGEPLRGDFCKVYASGTEQNFAAVVGTFQWGKAGRYLFNLTPTLDTGRLQVGRYRLTVMASDSAGNTGARTALIAVGGRALTSLPTPAPDSRCAPS